MAARAGADVAFSYVANEFAAQETANSIQSVGRKAFYIRGDVADETSITSALNRAGETLGGLCAVVVSAGVFDGAAVDKMTVELWNRIITINLTGTFLTVRAAVPLLRKNGGGSIVIYTSTAGQRGSAIYSAYASSKGGQIMFMRSMAKELATDRIRVNCVAPAWTDTEMARPSFDAIGRDKIIQGFPLGRIGLPDDAAGAAVYLMSDLAQFVTGMTLTVDGGQDMRG
jgi:3-oxoacyl-[acyl-carrier protein] reductase